jgi:hypothetical protein
VRFRRQFSRKWPENEKFPVLFPVSREFDLPRPVRANCVVSHAFPEIGDFAMTGAEARIPRAFADAEIGDRLEWVS